MWPFFAENKFQLTRKLSVSPGIRYESGESKMLGNISYLPPLEVENTIDHHFPLLGVNAEYTINNRQNIYAGFCTGVPPRYFPRTSSRRTFTSG